MKAGHRLALAALALVGCDAPPSGSDGGDGNADAAIGPVDASQGDAMEPSDAASPDGLIADAGLPISRRLVYLADQTIDEIPELFLVRMNGSTPLAAQRLHPPLEQDMRVANFEWAPDGSAVLFQADLYDTDEMSDSRDLYVVDVTGSPPYTPVKVNADFPPYQDAGPIRGTGVPRWSSDSARIAYLSDEMDFGIYELYVFQVTGPNAGSRWKVNGQLKINFDVNSFTWSPDGTRIAYRAIENDDWELFVAAVDDTGPTPAVVVSQGSVKEAGFRDLGMLELGFQFAPDSQSIAYRSRISDLDELYWVDLSGADPAPPVKISASLASGWVDSAFWAPDSGRIVYKTYNPHDLYAVDLTPSPAPAVKLNGLEYAGGSIVDDFPRWSPDSTKIAYFAGGNGHVELWVVNLAGVTPSVPRRANGTLPTNGDVMVSSANQARIAWSSDSAMLAFAAEQIDPFEPDLFVVDTTVTPPWTSQRVDSVHGTWSNYFYFAPGDRRLLYRTRIVASTSELYIADLSGSAPYSIARVNGALTLAGSVEALNGFDHAPWAWHHGGDWVGYIADERTNERFEAFVVDLAQAGTSAAASGALIPQGDVRDFAWSPSD